MSAKTTRFLVRSLNENGRGVPLFGEAQPAIIVHECPSYAKLPAGDIERSCVETAVPELKARGVVFDIYDSPGDAWHREIAENKCGQGPGSKDGEESLLSLGSRLDGKGCEGQMPTRVQIVLQYTHIFAIFWFGGVLVADFIIFPVVSG